ncbi:MAG: helix-turn-helix domain-containing protein [Ferruginibacter sp.]
MIFKTYPADPALANIVDYYWYSKIECTDSLIQNYPTPLLQGLAFNFHKLEEEHSFNGKSINLYKKAYFFGQPTCPRVITTNKNGVDILCVKFRPLGISKITGINMEHMADSFIAAEDIWGLEFEHLCDEMQSAPNMESTIKVLEKFILNKYLKIHQPYQSSIASNALKLIEKFNGDILIKDLNQQTNTTKKTLERTFKQHVGLTPKLYSQIVQFNSAKDFLEKMVNHDPVFAAGLETGYYNSSYFAAQFKRFSGETPKQYLKNNVSGNIV